MDRETSAALASSDAEPIAPPGAGWWLLTLAGSSFLVAGAVVLEIVSGRAANSPVGPVGELVPLAWPRPARVAWWLAVAGGAALARLSLHRLGVRQRAPIVVASVVPFVVFAGGIAAGAGWATWH